MTCPELPAEDLVAWLDGELPAAAAARVAAHLRGCAACRREAAALRESGAMLRRLPRTEPTAGFEGRVLAATRESAPRARLVRLRPRVAAAAAAVLLVAAAGAWYAVRPRGLLSASEEEAIVDDLVVLSNLDALEKADASEISQIVDDLDVLETFSDDADARGG